MTSAASASWPSPSGSSAASSPSPPKAAATSGELALAPQAGVLADRAGESR